MQRCLKIDAGALCITQRSKAVSAIVIGVCVVGPQVQRLITIRDTLFVFTNLVISVCAVSVGVGVPRIFLDSKTVLFDSALAPPQKAVIVSVVPG
jgi:hypothetical protein